MTSLARSLGIAVALLVFAGVQNASAQVTGTVDFTTSFPFTVGNASVPAGSYTITPDFDSPDILALSGGRTSVLFQTKFTDARQTPSKTEVVFKRYGDTYVLKDIWIAGSETGAETMPLEGERHAAKHGDAPGEQRVAATRKANTSARR
jgi:hypothetical protein